MDTDKDLNFIELLELLANFNVNVVKFSITNSEKTNRKIIKIVRNINTPSQI